MTIDGALGREPYGSSDLPTRPIACGTPPIHRSIVRCIRASIICALVVALSPTPSAAAASIAKTRDITYARRAGSSLTLDVARPVGARRAPVVILLHGGGWWHGDKADMRSTALDLAEAGFVVASVNYRLACGTSAKPRQVLGIGFTGASKLCGWRARDQVRDVQEAVRFVRLGARKWGGDGRRIAVVGSSAGGHLALVAAATAPFASRVSAVVNWSGPPSTRYIAEQRPGTRGSLVAAFTNAMGCAAAACPDTWSAHSPIELVTPRTRPFAVLGVASARERITPQATIHEFDRQLDGLRWNGQVAIAAGACHSRECLETPIVSDRMGGTVLQRSIRFLRRSM